MTRSGFIAQATRKALEEIELMNREEWLNLVADGMAPWFEDQGYPLPRCRIAIGFPSTGKRGKRIGECWDGRRRPMAPLRF